MSDPIARVVHTEPNPTFPGNVILTVICPHCGREHRHGGANHEAPDYGHRVAHCLRTSAGGYYIRDAR